MTCSSLVTAGFDHGLTADADVDSLGYRSN